MHQPVLLPEQQYCLAKVEMRWPPLLVDVHAMTRIQLVRTNPFRFTSMHHFLQRIGGKLGAQRPTDNKIIQKSPTHTLHETNAKKKDG